MNVIKTQHSVVFTSVIRIFETIKHHVGSVGAVHQGLKVHIAGRTGTINGAFLQCVMQKCRQLCCQCHLVQAVSKSKM